LRGGCVGKGTEKAEGRMRKARGDKTKRRKWKKYE
jgi:hypothetical protein